MIRLPKNCSATTASPAQGRERWPHCAVMIPSRVLRITKEKGECHSVDVARQLGVSKPSVSVAVAKLEEKGLLVMDAQKLLQLTPKGEAIARRIFERHMFFKNHLIGIGVDEDTAEYEACLLEHDISQQTFEKMKQALTH